MTKTEAVTTKEAAARLRKTLRGVAACAEQGADSQLRTSDGVHVAKLPAGLRYTVRATSTGVNVTIQDAGYVDAVTGGDRTVWEGPVAWHHTAPVIEQVKALQRFLYGQTLGKVEFGTVLLSARLGDASEFMSAASVTRIRPRGVQGADA